jgi:hypothetical protein
MAIWNNAIDAGDVAMREVPFAAIGDLDDRRLSRRATLHGAGLSMATIALASRAAEANAQTPVATPSTENEISLLFVQSFESGTFTPAAGQTGQYRLAIQHTIGHTVFFSDRPERVAGMMPTADFLQSMSFDTPPNAAFVVQLSSGDEAIAVLELSSPNFDPTERTLTYLARLLPGSESIDLDQRPLTAETLPDTFASASMFIDAETVVDAQGSISIKAYNNTRVAQKFDFFQHLN